jgi:hypothetical protein
VVVVIHRCPLLAVGRGGGGAATAAGRKVVLIVVVAVLSVFSIAPLLVLLLLAVVVVAVMLLDEGVHHDCFAHLHRERGKPHLSFGLASAGGAGEHVR